MASDIQQTPFVKQLAANDRPTRDAALQSLRTYLSGNRAMTALDHLKIWKGLFYTLWMSDRPRVQAQLCADLAALVAVLPPANVLPFLRAFWRTMAREWTGVDVLRMEKFLLLVRRYLGATLACLSRGAWDAGLVEGHLAVLEEIPLNVLDVRLPNGLRYHVIDVYVDELERVGALGGAETRDGVEVPLEKLLEPLRRLGKESPTKDVRRKCREALEDERLPGNEKEVIRNEVIEGEWTGIKDR